jgi:hypothetical protein
MRRRVQALADGRAGRNDVVRPNCVPGDADQQDPRNSGEGPTVHAASRINQLRKSSSAASHFIPASPSFVVLGLFSASSRSSASPRNKQDRIQLGAP